MKPNATHIAWLSLVARILASAFLPRPDRLAYILSLDPRGPKPAPVRPLADVRALRAQAPRA
jgi:hypothetical protein